MITIGPTFADELQAAGLAGLPFSWGPDGRFQFDKAMTPQQIAAVTAVLAAHDPTAKEAPPPDTLTPLKAAFAALAAAPAIPPPIKDVFAALRAHLGV